MGRDRPGSIATERLAPVHHHADRVHDGPTPAKNRAAKLPTAPAHGNQNQALRRLSGGGNDLPERPMPRELRSPAGASEPFTPSSDAGVGHVRMLCALLPEHFDEAVRVSTRSVRDGYSIPAEPPTWAAGVPSVGKGIPDHPDSQFVNHPTVPEQIQNRSHLVPVLRGEVDPT